MADVRAAAEPGSLESSTRDAAQLVERARRLAWMAGWGLFGSAFLFEALAILRGNQAWLIHRLPDDAYYYIEIGRRIARGQGATFDGLHHTNGFHPLWQSIIAMWALVFHGQALVRVVLLTQLGAVLAAFVTIYRMLARVWTPEVALVAVAIAVHGDITSGRFADGMESGVVLLSLVVATWCFVRVLERTETSRALWLGVSCGVVVLARIDLASVIWIIPVVLLATRRNWRVAAVVAGAAAATVAPWALWSRLWTGEVLPISGAIKLNTLSKVIEHDYGGRLTVAYARWLGSLAKGYAKSIELDANHSPFSDSRGPFAAFSHHALTLLALVGLVLAFARWYRRRSSGTRGPLSATAIALFSLTVAVIVKAAIDLVTLPFWADLWYSSTTRVLLGLLLGAGVAVAVGALSRYSVRIAVACGCCVVLLCIPASVGHFHAAVTERPQHGGWQDAQLEAVDWMRTQPKSIRFGSTDAGAIGYYADPLTVVNLDGLVNDAKFAKLVEHDVDVFQRARSQRVDVLIQRHAATNPDVPTCARVLWQSRYKIPYGGGVDDPFVTLVPLTAFDLRGC